MSHTQTKLVKPTAARERIIALDALRILAALVVLAQHFRQIFELNWPLWLRSGLFQDQSAVGLFFVLSGYVLALSLSSKAPSFKEYVKFGIRRVLRLYPVFWAALALSFFVLWILQKQEAGTPTGVPLAYLDGNGLQLKQWVLQSTLVAPGINFHFALPPMWTLMIEARVSIFFPFLAWVILRSSGGLAGLVVAALMLGGAWLDQHVATTAAFLGLFALGIGLCRIPHAFWSQLSHLAWWRLALLGIGLYTATSFSHEAPGKWPCYYLSGLGSLILIAGAIHWQLMRSTLTRFQKLLRLDLSYDIYILHYPVLVAVKKLSGSYIPAIPWLAFILVLALCAALSLLLHFLIEKPAIELSRRLTLSRTSASQKEETVVSHFPLP